MLGLRIVRLMMMRDCIDEDGVGGCVVLGGVGRRSCNA